MRVSSVLGFSSSAISCLDAIVERESREGKKGSCSPVR